MFELTELKEYWIIVSYDGSSEVLILRESDDCKEDDIFSEGIIGDDNDLDEVWHKDQPAGIYRLVVDPVYDDGYIEKIKVAEHKQLYVFPEDY